MLLRENADFFGKFIQSDMRILLDGFQDFLLIYSPLYSHPLFVLSIEYAYSATTVSTIVADQILHHEGVGISRELGMFHVVRGTDAGWAFPAHTRVGLYFNALRSAPAVRPQRC